MQPIINQKKIFNQNKQLNTIINQKQKQTMKRLVLVLLVAVMAAPMFQSCKKGANDPGISFKSRKARLVAEWKLESGSITYTSGTGYTDTYTSATISRSTGGSASYTETVEILKDGTFKRTILNDGNTTVDNGQWYFMEANKDKDVKSKEMVSFFITQEVYTPAGGTVSTSTYTGITPDYAWRLDELKSKEIIILIDESSQTGSSYSAKGTMTYTSK